MNDLAIKSFQIKNFKAIQDSNIVELVPLTVFIGNNGSGKSSFIEGLETYKTIIKQGLDAAMSKWRGFEHLRNKINPHELETSEDGTYESNPMAFELCRQMNGSQFCANMAITLDKEKELLIQNEKLAFSNILMVERKANNAFYFPEVDSFDFSAPASNEFSILSKANSALWAALSRYIRSMGESFSTTMLMRWLDDVNKNKQFWDSFDWQFISLNPDNMLAPTGQKRVSREVQLNKDGSNIAKYLLSIRKLNPAVFSGILETLQRILPYAQNLQVVLSTELERNVYIELTEGECKIADWLLSTGTLRIVALLALLRHPNPPPLIVIEEIENGLDPRTIRLMVEEICKIVEAGKTQIILTTHSPYFLDLLQPEQVVLVERDSSGQPTFNKVDEHSKLESWAKHFMPVNRY
ncbi:MAG: ATP-binding protein [Candidatus Marithrix sp.]